MRQTGHIATPQSATGPKEFGREDPILAAQHEPRRHSRPPAAFPFLTERAREVLDLIARGLTNAAIAGRLYLSDKTVDNHVSTIVTRQHLTDRAAAVARARNAGYGLAAQP